VSVGGKMTVVNEVQDENADSSIVVSEFENVMLRNLEKPSKTRCGIVVMKLPRINFSKDV
jgi:hypothetical protein